MAHSHSIIDSDLRFIVKPSDRTIINLSGKIILVQGDHNSERFTFEVPRYIDGHDMFLCDVIEIHYLNGTRPGIYEIDDMQLDPENDSVIIFTWLISSNGTKNTGPLNFAIRFKCMTDNAVSYAWKTAIHSGIIIVSGINNTETLSDNYTDDYIEALTRWEAQFTALETSVQEAENARVTAETSRISAEENRVSEEQNRADAETQRVEEWTALKAEVEQASADAVELSQTFQGVVIFDCGDSVIVE